MWATTFSKWLLLEWPIVSICHTWCVTGFKFWLCIFRWRIMFQHYYFSLQRPIFNGKKTNYSSRGNSSMTQEPVNQQHEENVRYISDGKFILVSTLCAEVTRYFWKWTFRKRPFPPQMWIQKVRNLLLEIEIWWCYYNVL